MSILCTICMRGGSKGIKNKCVKNINGKPLLEYTIKQAQKINFIDNIVVSTDSKKIFNLSSKYGIENWFIRPKCLSNDRSGKILVIRDALLRSEKYFKKHFDVIIDLDITSPLRSNNDIKNSYKKFKDTNSEILFSVTKSRKNPYFNMVEIIKNKTTLVKEDKLIIRRQDAPQVYDMNASVYIWKRDALIKNDTLFSNKTNIYVMPQERSIDIDNKLDFKLVEYLLKEKNNG